MADRQSRPGQWATFSTSPVFRLDQSHAGGLLWRPEAFPSASESIAALGDELVQVLEELRESAVDIEHAGVMVVGLNGAEDHPDPGAPRRLREAEDESLDHVGGESGALVADEAQRLDLTAQPAPRVGGASIE